MESETVDLDMSEVMTLEAFADTVIPGERRHPQDHAIAGAAPGGGAVASGAIAALISPEGGLGPILPTLARALNDHARAYAERHGRTVERGLPPFVALAFADRTALAAELMSPDSQEQEMWVPLAMFSFMAWDTGATVRTADALAAGHPGLTTMGFAPPGPDGLWTFPEFSYGRQLAAVHPQTTASGDPA